MPEDKKNPEAEIEVKKEVTAKKPEADTDSPVVENVPSDEDTQELSAFMETYGDKESTEMYSLEGVPEPIKKWIKLVSEKIGFLEYLMRVPYFKDVINDLLEQRSGSDEGDKGGVPAESASLALAISRNIPKEELGIGEGEPNFDAMTQAASDRGEAQRQSEEEERVGQENKDKELERVLSNFDNTMLSIDEVGSTRGETEENTQKVKDVINTVLSAASDGNLSAEEIGQLFDGIHYQGDREAIAEMKKGVEETPVTVLPDVGSSAGVVSPAMSPKRPAAPAIEERPAGVERLMSPFPEKK